MKKIIIILALIVGLATTQSIYSQVSVSVDFNTFYTSLSPYGRWVDYPAYGRIWICNEQGFRPYYTDGHWEYTSDGWTWVSDYSWGWAPFHYGRWAYIDDYGWSWVPGYDWAPAWVSWSSDEDYYGWAPLSPGLAIGVSISSIPAERWCFVPHQYINSPAIRNYYIDNSRNITIYKNVTIINNQHASHNVRYIAGPRKEDVERVNHTTIQTRIISNTSNPGRTVVTNNTVNIYRPAIRKHTATVNSASNSNNNIKPIVNTTPASNRVNQNHHHIQNKQPVLRQQSSPQRKQTRQLNNSIQNNQPHNSPVHQRVNAPTHINQSHQQRQIHPPVQNNSPNPERMPTPERNSSERKPDAHH